MLPSYLVSIVKPHEATIVISGARPVERKRIVQAVRLFWSLGDAPNLELDPICALLIKGDNLPVEVEQRV